MNAVANSAVFQKSGIPERLLTAELAALHDEVRLACPRSAIVSLCFDGRFNLFVDVQTHQEAAEVEAILPTLADGAFQAVHRCSTPHQPFRRRIAAIVVA